MFQQLAENTNGLLTVRSIPYGSEVVVVELAGELDLADVGTAETAIMDPLETTSAHLVIDLQELEFFDLSGVALLARVSKLAGSRDRVRLIPSRHAAVMKVLELTGMTSMLTFVHDGAGRAPAGSASGSG